MNSINVVDIRFLAEGGEILKDYNHIPMSLNEVVNRAGGMAPGVAPIIFSA